MVQLYIGIMVVRKVVQHAHINNFAYSQRIFILQGAAKKVDP